MKGVGGGGGWGGGWGGGSDAMNIHCCRSCSPFTLAMAFWRPCLGPVALGSVLGLGGLVSVYCASVR